MHSPSLSLGPCKACFEARQSLQVALVYIETEKAASSSKLGTFTDGHGGTV